MKALLLENEVIEVKTESFPVAPPLVWCDCDDTVTAGWRLESGVFLPPETEPTEPTEKAEEETT